MTIENIKVTKEMIIAKIEKDLKSKTYKDFNFSIEGIEMEPIYTSSEIIESNTDLGPISPLWQIAQRYRIEEPRIANKEILKDLNEGVNALICDFSKHDKWTIEDMKLLYKDVNIPYISLHLRGLGIESTKQFQNFIPSIAIGKDIITSDLFVTQNQRYKKMTISDMDSICVALEELNSNTSEAFHYYFEIEIGQDYFYEISKIRALHLLWNKMMTFYKQDHKIYAIGICGHKSQESDELNNNMIRNTLEAMSGIIGGIDVLYINPNDESEENIKFSSRISKNIQMILQEESAFGLVSDPSKGSYYIERLTNAIAEKVWEKFRKAN